MTVSSRCWTSRVARCSSRWSTTQPKSTSSCRSASSARRASVPAVGGADVDARRIAVAELPSRRRGRRTAARARPRASSRRPRSTVTRPWTAPVRSTTIAGLDVGVEHHRERVLERRPLVQERRDGFGHRLGRAAPLGGDVAVGDPAERPVGRVVDEEQVARAGRPRARPRASAAVVADAADRRPAQLEVGDAEQRQALEPAVRADEPGDELRRGRGEDLEPAARTGRGRRRPGRPRRGRPS